MFIALPYQKVRADSRLSLTLDKTTIEVEEEVIATATLTVINKTSVDPPKTTVEPTTGTNPETGTFLFTALLLLIPISLMLIVVGINKTQKES